MNNESIAINEMNPSSVSEQAEYNATMLAQTLQLQRDDFLNSHHETYQQRVEHLQALKRLLVDNREALLAALCQDYGNRSYHESLLAEYIVAVSDIDANLKHLKQWMKPQRRGIDKTLYFGAKNRVIPQPLGVVGVITPWNFPINLTFTQLSAIFAAGNRAMVKMSENSPALCALLQQLSSQYFPAEKLQFFPETGSVGIEFSKLPFDHIIFTGSGETGKKVMASAAQNLTPVTLELGGKCPAIIAPDFPLKTAVARVLFVKQFNAGQICTTVDYAWVHQSQLEDFVSLAKQWVAKHLPDIHSLDYTSIIDDRSFVRLQQTLQDAKQKGATLIPLSSQPADAKTRKMPVTLVLNTTPEMLIRQRETFGPLLMVQTYQTHDEVIDAVNAGPRPLAIYPFSNDNSLIDLYIERIMSGGVTVNDALFHVGQHDMPFGGVGASGMGHYHGYEGFVTFSKLRPVMYQAKRPASTLLVPPYKQGWAEKLLNFSVKLKEK